MTRLAVLAGFLLLTLGVGFVIGTLTPPGAWYAGLAKPTVTPPDWVFPVVWAILYTCIAIAGYRTFVAPAAALSMTLWWTQLGLNFLWPILFFAAHQVGLAFVAITLLLAVILAFMHSRREADPLSAGLFVPYAAWVAFASYLNGYILAAN